MARMFAKPVVPPDEGDDSDMKVLVWGTSQEDVIDAAYVSSRTGARTVDAAERINALNGDDVAYGYGGNDAMLGGLGNDRLYGGDGDDEISGTSGSDMLWGEAGNDTLDGGGPKGNFVSGGAGEDAIVGGEGADVISGGADNDSITGGGGLDVFYVANNEGTDTIADFSRTDGDLVWFSDAASLADVTATLADLDPALTGLDSVVLSYGGTTVNLVATGAIEDLDAFKASHLKVGSALNTATQTLVADVDDLGFEAATGGMGGKPAGVGGGMGGGNSAGAGGGNGGGMGGGNHTADALVADHMGDGWVL